MKPLKNRKTGKASGPSVSRWAAEAERLYNLGQYQAALQVAGEGLVNLPDDPLAWNLCAAAAHALGHTADAEQFWRTAILKQPDFAKAHFNLGILFFQQERFAEAETALREAIRLAPTHSKALDALASVLMRTNRPTEATGFIRQALASDPGNASAHNNLGVINADLKNHAEALASFSKAIASNSRLASAYSNRGYLYMETGAFAEAERDLNTAIRIDPNLTEAYLNLALMEKPRAEAPWLKQLEAAYQRRGALTASQQCFLEFAMGKVREGLKDYDAAFAAYQAGNDLHFGAHPYDEAMQERWLADTTSRYTAEVLALGTERPEAGDGDGRVPVFIVGMPRSGSTLLEQILSSHPDFYGAGELSLMPDIVRQLRFAGGNAPNWEKLLPRLRALGKNYLDQVWKRSPDSHFISDKLPGNFRHLGLLHLMLPQARIIHSMRDPMDTCLSCYFLRFKQGHEYTYDLGALGRYYLRYAQVMDHWRKVLPPGKMLDVSYEELIENPEQQIRRLLDYVGLPWDPACLNFHENKRAVGTASVAQVRKQMYSSSRGRWRRFEKHLAPLAAILGQT